MANIRGRDERAVKMDPFDKRVGCYDIECAPCRLDNSGVVADPS